jgi:hypothetical protein
MIGVINLWSAGCREHVDVFYAAHAHFCKAVSLSVMTDSYHVHEIFNFK